MKVHEKDFAAGCRRDSGGGVFVLFHFVFDGVTEKNLSHSRFSERDLIFSGFCGKIIKSHGGVKVSTGILKFSKRAERAEAL